MKYIVLLLLLIGCTNAPNGAISYNTTSYYIDGKFTDEIPDSLIIRLYGYKLVDDMNGKEHTYRQPVIMRHNSTITLWCTVHRGWENVKSMWLVTKKGNGIVISNHKKF